MNVLVTASEPYFRQSFARGGWRGESGVPPGRAELDRIARAQRPGGHRHARGANYINGRLFKAFAVRDGRLITGQQQYSGRNVVQIVIEALGV